MSWRRQFYGVLLVFVLSAGAAPSLWAYVDPGAGSLLIQYLVGMALGGLILLRKNIGALLQRLPGFKKPKPKPKEKS